MNKAYCPKCKDEELLIRATMYEYHNVEDIHVNKNIISCNYLSLEDSECIKEVFYCKHCGVIPLKKVIIRDET